jgi:hypothetical protein
MLERLWWLYRLVYLFLLSRLPANIVGAAVIVAVLVRLVVLVASDFCIDMSRTDFEAVFGWSSFGLSGCGQFGFGPSCFGLTVPCWTG